MKKSVALLTIFLSFLIICSSCFEIREELELNGDGSGTFSFIIDLSKIKNLMQGMGESDDGSPFQDMEAEFEETRTRLEVVEGITNIRFVSENDGYVVRSSFDFANIESLNKGINQLLDNEDQEDVEYYRMKRNRISRTGSEGIIEEVKGELMAEEVDVEGFDLSAIFADVAYVNTIRFRERQVTRVVSGNPVVSEDRSTVTNRFLVFSDDPEQSMSFEVKAR